MRKWICFIVSLMGILMVETPLLTAAGDSDLVEIDSTLLLKEEQDLKITKDKFVLSAKKRLFHHDKRLYNQILALISEMLNPILDKEREIQAGQERFDVAIYRLNELLFIHKKEGYCTTAKEIKLRTLLRNTRKDLRRLNTMQCLPFKLDNATLKGKLQPELKVYLKNVKKKTVKAVGGNISIGLFGSPGVGFAMGTSTNACGKKHFSLLSQSVTSLAFGIHGAAGYYGFTMDSSNSRGNKEYQNEGGYFRNKWRLNSAGCLIGRSYLDPHLAPPYYNHMDPGADPKEAHIFEGGVDLGAHLFKSICFRGLEVCGFASGDWKVFRENLSLVPETGELPHMLKEQIDAAESEEDLKRNIHLHGFEPRK